MDIPQFVYSPIEGHLGCFQVLTIMNKAAVNIYLQVLCGHKCSAHLCKYPGAQFLGPMVKLCLAL